MATYRNTNTGDIFTSAQPSPRLERLANWQRIDAEPDTSPDEADARPRGNASRDAWVRHAASLGLDAGDSMTRDDIRELVDMLEADG